MKEKIIQKATQLFLSIGFKSVTMDDLATEMAISKKTIYTHFSNKTELVRECTCSIMNTITDGIDSICAQNHNPIEEIYEIKRLVLSHLKDEKSSPQYQLQKYYPEINESLKELHFEKMMELTRRNLQRGIKQGLYRSSLDVEFIARLYFMCVHGTKDENLFLSEKFSKQFVTEEYLEYHLRGIVTEKGYLTLNKYIKEQHTNA
ncbi:TetR/AcrR family transcriptional regulator [Aequorivita echinoideorum]|uniref:TetR/AcrR family transcriptional regulator n=1 Tax=Aequorivita echinoideorum TaxID=1549647 RepID=A0ABS5S3M3_9FLAO|nr:TetR/AcrR family transcriptional regulator [Aequorivita echinoideorum]MBT0607805.1 TetR/AcrR family transcriptional regulator [Aequorivita echinoideorum]